MSKHLKFGKTREYPGAFIAPFFVSGLLSGPESKGIDVDGYMHQAGINPEHFRTHADYKVTPIQYAALFYALVNGLKDECPGVFSRPLKPGSFALTAREGLAALNLRGALKRICPVVNLLQDDIHFSVQISGDEAALRMEEINPDQPMPIFAQATVVRVFWRLSAWLLNSPLPIRHFDFTCPDPAHHSDFQLVFPAPRRYEQASFGFWFKRSELQTPVSRDEIALRTFLTDAYTQIISPPRNFGVVGQKVRNCLMRSYPQWPSLIDVAKRIHTSPASLQRHLAAEHTAYQWLKDDLRRDLAISRLSSSSASLVQLASELGFNDSPAFQRAFKGWTGKSCGAYRRPARC